MNVKTKSNISVSARSEAVEEFIDDLVHPYKAVLSALREAILGIDPSISEEIKWNSPSFRTSEHFATMNLRSKHGLLLILHFGAKKRALPDLNIDDPHGILKWLGPDRASVSFADGQDLANKKPALEAVIRQWLKFVDAE